MRVAIIDIDHNEQVSLTPNPWLMKLSAYYKQMGHDVALVEEVLEPDKFDEIIIAKENNTSYLPPASLLIHKNTKLIGKAFRRQKKFWRLPIQVYRARPDYSLYTFKYPSEFTGASFINSSYRGELIGVQKQDRVEMEAAINFIIDDDFWNIKDLGAALDHISQYNKIIFLEEVDIIKLLNNNLIEKFVKLRLFPRPIKLKKVSSLEELVSTIKVLNEVKKRKNISFENLSFITMTKELNGNEALERYYDCIRAAEAANKYSVKLDYLVPRVEVFEHAQIFEPFLKYRNHLKSFFSYLIERDFYRPADEILNNQHSWENPVVATVWAIYFKNREVFESGFIGWGGHPDQARKKLDEGEAEKFYDKYIL